MPVIFTAPEIAALIWFLLAWIGYSFTLEHGRFARQSLNARMDRFRRDTRRHLAKTSAFDGR